MPVQFKIRVAANFERNLDEIECFFKKIEQPRQFEVLLDQLFDIIIPNLQHFPLLGKDFLAEPQGSVESTMLLQKIKSGVSEDASIRQYLSKDYLVPYWLDSQEIVLLGIKHHRQLNFNIQ